MGSDVSARRRILSVDVLRGLTVACMILVNNGYGESFAQLRHSVWNGLTLSDMVFPFFLFIMGLSGNLSRRQDPGRILWRPPPSCCWAGPCTTWNSPWRGPSC